VFKLEATISKSSKEYFILLQVLAMYQPGKIRDLPILLTVAWTVSCQASRFHGPETGKAHGRAFHGQLGSE